MVKFSTIIGFARYLTDSRLTLAFNSLCSMEFLLCTVGDKLRGWDMEELHFYAEWDSMVYIWHGPGAPRDFTGEWMYIQRVGA